MAGMGGGCHRSLNAEPTPIFIQSNPQTLNELSSNFTDRGFDKTSPGLEMAEHTLENQTAVILA